MSTIMNALRKVEKQKSAASQTAGPDELDRQIVDSTATARKGIARRVAVIATAVVVSGLAGVGLTLAALSVLDSEPVTQPSAASVGAVSAPAEAAAALSEGEPRDEPRSDQAIVVAADVLQQENETVRDAAASNGTPPAVSAPLTSRVVADPDAIARLEARREARRLRLRENLVEAEAQLAEPEPTQPKTAVAPVRRAPQRVSRAAAPDAPSEPVVAQPAAATPPQEVEVDAITAHQREETRAIEAELDALEQREQQGTPVVEPPMRASEETVVAEPGVFERAVDEDISPDVETAVSVTPRSRSIASPERTPTPPSEALGVPKYAIRGTTWHPHRQRRTATIEVESGGKSQIVEIREGEMLGPMKVSEIGPTDVTFLHEGKKVRRQIGAGLR